jgi:hypothetical protein
MLRLVNRNLQLTLLSGSIVFALMSLVPTALDLASGATNADFFKLIMLAGLPVMLAVMSGARSSQLERVVARATATCLIALAYIHTLMFWSAAWFVIMPTLVLVAFQVGWMRRLDSKEAACS